MLRELDSSAPAAELRRALDGSRFDARDTADARAAFLRELVARNPEVPEEEARGMLAWDVENYERPHWPCVVGTLRERAEFSRAAGLRVLDMLVREPGGPWAVPEAFAQFREVLELAVRCERALNPHFDERYFAYLTVDQKVVEPGLAQRRVGWHGDAFVSPETSRLEDGTVIVDDTYVAFDSLSTLFLPGPFSLRGVDSTDIRAVLARFDESALGCEPRRYPPFTLLRMTPYVVHTPDVNTTSQPIRRTFVKIQFSRDRLNMLGNTLNRAEDEHGRRLVSYDGWTWIARDPGRRNNRNSILGWDRPDRDAFRTVDATSVDFDAPRPDVDWLAPEFFWGRKVEGVQAEPAVEGEQLETVARDGAFRSSFNIAQRGDWKVTTSQGDQYFLSEAKLRARYHVADSPSAGYFAPRGAPSRMALVVEPIRYRSPWGAWAYANAGSVLTRVAAADVYAILPQNFRASYVRTDEHGAVLVHGGERLDEVRARRPGRLVRVRDELVSFRAPHLAVFDLHGTLAQPNWKAALARVFLRFEPRATEAEASAWIDAASYGRADGEVLEALARAGGGVPVAEVSRLFQEERKHIGRTLPLRAMPGAPEFVRMLFERGVRSAVLTFAHTSRERTLGQLAEIGLRDLVEEERVLTAEMVPQARDRESFRTVGLERLAEEHPGAQLLFFNDTPDGFAAVRRLGGIAFGVPQGEGADWELRSLPLIAAGAHFLVQDWRVAARELEEFAGAS